MATYKIASATANSMVNAEAALAASGKIAIYTGPMPTNPDTAVTTQTLLATLTISGSFQTASGGVATANGIASATAVASGDAAWFRLLKSDGTTAIGDGDVGTTADAVASLQFDSVSFVSGGTISITAFTLTEPQD